MTETRNKDFLVEAVQNALQEGSESKVTKKTATLAVNTVFDTIKETLAEGEKVKIHQFGNFEVRTRSARKGRNPSSGEEIFIPETKAPAFKASKAFKNLIKEG